MALHKSLPGGSGVRRRGMVSAIQAGGRTGAERAAGRVRKKSVGSCNRVSSRVAGAVGGRPGARHVTTRRDRYGVTARCERRSGASGEINVLRHRTSRYPRRYNMWGECTRGKVCWNVQQVTVVETARNCLDSAATKPVTTRTAEETVYRASLARRWRY